MIFNLFLDNFGCVDAHGMIFGQGVFFQVNFDIPGKKNKKQKNCFDILRHCHCSLVLFFHCLQLISLPNCTLLLKSSSNHNTFMWLNFRNRLNIYYVQ